MIDIKNVISKLKNNRPLFHSEADFQLAFAWEIQSQYPNAQIRLEYNYPYVSNNVYLDIWVNYNGINIPIELKYKTKKSSFIINDEAFNLKNHSAQDCGRYDFIKDISRLEQVISKETHSIGYAIMLTNDNLYWNVSTKIDSVDAAFKIHEGRNLCGALAWGELASAGTKRGRESEIVLTNSYNLNWNPYSKVSDSSSGEFKILIVEVS
ncbi:hypothetical protein [Aneurinibacillus aneurinilyticus]|jgi:hypothetical protein|uniref:hypothetical protein n=1 Tax=Aneurinibacillus aneurinilyticus TaxID=1391 RepID=UPI0023F76540|nr:hypothetical protein [Aneurinibacillus aneurinilyticus]MCI1693298.1 hypothetical protein [Aneurinibacillus aneurinilyticus]